jgi:hypothetical protein
VFAFEDHFRRHVLVSAADAGADVFFIRPTGPPEVAQLHVVLVVEQQVLRLDVPVNDALVVQVLHSQGRLVQEPHGQVPRQAVLGVDEEKHAAVAGVLEQQIDHVALSQTVEVLDSVGVFEGLVEFDFIGQVVPVWQGKRVFVDLLKELP